VCLPARQGLLYLPPHPKGTLHIGLIDCSSSMAATDYPPDRCEAGKQAFQCFIQTRAQHFPNDFVGIVAFNHQASVVHPPVQLGDPHSLHRLAQSLSLIFPNGQTNLDVGLMQSYHLACEYQYLGVEYLRVLVLTDGHSSGDPVAAAQYLKEAGGVIEIVGIARTPADVNEPVLKQCASWQNGRLLYRFIGDGDSEALISHFGGLALE
jgi:Mg-chelatase subunit ChlD